jgi:cellulase/cellobiase CelA1
VKNGTETDKDCGGSCSGCALGKTCGVNADCAQGTCQAGVCTAQSSGVTASIRMDSDWGAGYCSTLLINNGAQTATKSWNVKVGLAGAQLGSSAWNGVFTSTTTGFAVTNLSWNGAVAPGTTSSSVGFCATRSSGNALPVVEGVTATF